MKVKVQCPCGTRFEFEVEPVNDRMPVAINCPSCGAEATELANAVIRQQSQAAPPASIPVAPAIAIAQRPAAPAAPAAPAPPAAAAPASGLRIARSAHSPAPAPAASAALSQAGRPAAAPAVAEGTPVCPKHQTEPAVEACRVCKKPMCLKCMEQFGYVCSVYCRQQATAKRIYIPPYAHQKSVVAGKANALAKYLTYAGILLFCGLFGLWIWYTWFARAPKIVYSLPIPKSNSESKRSFRPDEYYRLIGPGQLVSIKNKQLALFDVAEQKQLWSVALQTAAETDAINAARTKNENIQKRTPKTYDRDGFETTRYLGMDPLGFEGDFVYSNPTVVATTNDIWVVAGDRLARFDRQSGSRKDTGIAGKIRSVSPGADAILVVSSDSNGGETLTEITLPDGASQTEEIKAPGGQPKTIAAAKKTVPALAAVPAAASDAPAPGTGGRRGGRRAGRVAPADKIPVDKVKSAATQATATDAPDEDAMASLFDEDRQHPFVMAGANVVQFETTLLEHKTLAHEVVRAPKKTSLVDSGKLTAGQSLEATQELLNDMRHQQNNGTIEEDVSEYQATVHRRFAKDIPDWTGQVTGQPEFFALKTVDVVAAGKAIYVIDKSNKKLWEAKLTYSVPSRFGSENPPCLETKDALYFADQGMLTKFDLASGNVSWRLNSVGISRVQEDRRGNLLLNSTTAGPESIQYSEEVNIHEKVHALILDVAPATGKVIWRQESIGDLCILSGKFLYATKVSSSFAALRFEQGPDIIYNLRLLNPSTGNEIWNFRQGNRRVVTTEVQDNWILVQCDDEVMVLKFFSL